MANKKGMSVGKILYFVAALLGVLAVLGLFLTAITQKVGNAALYLEASDVFFGTDLTKGTIYPFIAILVLMLGGLYFMLNAFKKQDKKLTLIVVILMVLATVVVFCTKSLFVGANEILDVLKSTYHLGIGPVVSGLCGAFSTVVGCFATFFVKK